MKLSRKGYLTGSFLLGTMDLKKHEVEIEQTDDAISIHVDGKLFAIRYENNISNERRLNIMTEVECAKKARNIVEDIDNTVDAISKQVCETHDRLLSLNTAILGTNPVLDSTKEKEDSPDLSGYIQLHLQKLGDISRQLVEVSKLLKPLEEQFLGK